MNVRISKEEQGALKSPDYLVLSISFIPFAFSLFHSITSEQHPLSIQLSGDNPVCLCPPFDQTSGKQFLDSFKTFSFKLQHCSHAESAFDMMKTLVEGFGSK